MDVLVIKLCFNIVYIYRTMWQSTEMYFFFIQNLCWLIWNKIYHILKVMTEITCRTAWLKISPRLNSSNRVHSLMRFLFNIGCLCNWVFTRPSDGIILYTNERSRDKRIQVTWFHQLENIWLNSMILNENFE
jgi:hypothetical protein